MEVEELKRYKREIESKILELLLEFTDKTGLTVSDINLIVNTNNEMNKQYPVAVFYDVSVEVKI